MGITDVIKARRSVRTYSGKALDERQKSGLKEYIASLTQPLGGRARIELISRESGSEPAKLGTYGVISGASDYLVLIYEDGPLGAANAAYMFEQVVLYCTEQGLGTCWLGGTFKKSGFASQANVRNNELVRIVSPVGEPAAKTRLLDRMMRAGAGSNKRKAFNELFFEGGFDKPLTRGGLYEISLEMVRLAPSASNSQPWRVLVDGNGVHFYFARKSYLTDIDMGIALCHFELTCREMGMRGAFGAVNNAPTAEGMLYLVSWSPDK